ncbi:MAG: AAA family ATPase, partial [Synergistaceae bacterium]|nr:AAA family ATPase [Synergistaceae bacterium]
MSLDDYIITLEKQLPAAINHDNEKENGEIPYVRRKAAEWLLKLLESDVYTGNAFFVFLNWIIGDLGHVFKGIAAQLRENGDPEFTKALEALSATFLCTKCSKNYDDIADGHPRIADVIRKFAASECSAIASSSSPDSLDYARARNALGKFFGVSREGAILCEFVYLKWTCSVLKSYFEDHVDIWDFSNRGTLARMLNISSSALRESIEYLTSCGLLDGETDDGLYLKRGAESLWEETNLQDMSSLFCKPPVEQAPPFDSFLVYGDTVRHVEELLSKKDDPAKETAPVHILLYGLSGAGKTTFAQSLAKSLGVKAWTVLHNWKNNDGYRRRGLIACLNMAKEHPGSFVIVDEAEEFLSKRLSRWSMSIWKKPGSRVIWILNQTEPIQPDMKQRFSFSVYFGALGKQEQRSLWNQILVQHGMESCLSESRLEMLAENYQAPAATFEEAVRQAKEMACGEDGKNRIESREKFGDAIERVLKAHVALCGNDGTPTPSSNLNGRPPPPSVPRPSYSKPNDDKMSSTTVKVELEEGYTLEGVCLDGSVDELLDKCRRANARYVDGSMPRSGGNMLFYGAPGTGKTALAKYIASELGRGCLVKRGSDILTSYVG